VPLTGTERQIMSDMKKRYGKKKGKSVFYATATKGKLGKATKKRHGSKKGKRRSKKKKAKR